MDSAPPSSSLLAGITISPALFLGLVLLVAIIGGYWAHFFHLPRVIGFLLAGVLLRAVLWRVSASDDSGATAQALEQFATTAGVVKQLALGVILFTIGEVFEHSRLKSAGPRVRKISRFEVVLTLLFVCAGCWIVARLTQPQSGGVENFILALLLGMAAIATAPAATLLVLQEYEAKGPITETILGLTGINNVICIVLFYATFLVLASLGSIRTSGELAEHLWSALALTTVGSVVLGIVCGTVLSIVHTTRSIAETLLVFLALFVLLGAGETLLLEHAGMSFNFLLTTLVIGGIFANLAKDAQKLDAALHILGAPLFACFFVLAGYGLHIGDLPLMGWVGAAYILCRTGGKVVGCHLGVKSTTGPQRTGGRLGTALLCQAAVVIGLAAFVEQNWDSELAKQFSTVVLGSVVVFELVGPLLVKRCAVEGGEVKAATLLRREEAAAEGVSIVSLTLRSLQRLFRFGSNAGLEASGDMTAQHIMRTNVGLIPASATFDEVLHFIERSRFSHFPVVQEDGTLFGMIHFSDMHDLIYDPATADLVTALDIADPEAATVPMDMPLADLLEVFTSRDVGVLPVVEREESRHIVGLVEQRDLLRALRRAKKNIESRTNLAH